MMNNKKLSKLKILPVNKTVVFNSPIEGEDVLVRTGTISEGSCFFHALLHAFSNDYSSMIKKDRMKFVRRVRASMAGNIDMESWEEMGGGLIAKIPFQEYVSNILKNFDLFIKGNKNARGRSTRRTIKKLVGNDSEELEKYNIIFQLVSVDIFQDKILPKAYKISEDETIDYSINEIINESIKYLDDLPSLKRITQEKREYLYQVLKKFLKIMCEESKKQAYQDYVKGLQNVKEEIDTYTIDFISERFNRNVYFIDGNTRLPYNNLPNESLMNNNNKKAVIIIWIDNKHYEIVGRLLPGNRVQREFDLDDPLIDKIKTYILYPEELEIKYPEILSYSKKVSKSPIRKDKNTGDSPAKSDISSVVSDVYYDSSDNSTDSNNSD